MALDQQVELRVGGAARSIDTFLAGARDDLTRGLLSPRAMGDPEIHRAELERIFTKCWVYVGHVSEIESAGDYALRYVGEDQFILTRDESGEIRLLLNLCMHRASPVCRAEKGNASHFRCPYHGWIYRNTGEWRGAPLKAKAYRNPASKDWGLRAAPHVDSYQGLIFACLDPDAVPLKDYLGDMCWYLDVLFGVDPAGMHVMGDPHRWVIPANWKSGAENFAGDAYHLPTLHRSTEEVGVVPSIDAIVESEFAISLENGHGLIGHRGFLPAPQWSIMDYPQEVVDTFDLDGMTDGQRAFLENRFGISVFTIFPNLSFIRAPAVTDPNGMPAVFTSLRLWKPHGPGETEIWNWPIGLNSAPGWYNQLSYDTGVVNFSASGVFEQDDTVAWSGGPQAGRSVFADRTMKLNFQMGLDDMSVPSEPMPDFAGPGETNSGVLTEVNQRRWWQRWCELMMAE